MLQHWGEDDEQKRIALLAYFDKGEHAIRPTFLEWIICVASVMLFLLQLGIVVFPFVS